MATSDYNSTATENRIENQIFVYNRRHKKKLPVEDRFYRDIPYFQKKKLPFFFYRRYKRDFFIKLDFMPLVKMIMSTVVDIYVYKLVDIVKTSTL